MTSEKLRPSVFDEDQDKTGVLPPAEPITKDEVLEFERKFLKVNRDN